VVRKEFVSCRLIFSDEEERAPYASYIGSHWREDEQSECGGLEVSAVGLTSIYRKVQIDKRTIPIESIDHKAGGLIGTPRLEDSSPTADDGAKL